MADAQSIHIFSRATGESAVKLLVAQDTTTPEYQQMKEYFLENASKAKAIIENLVENIG